MNTPAHLILGAATLGRPRMIATNIAAISGSLLPDLSLYLLTAHALLVQQHSARYVFSTLYFSPEWQQVFAIDNSIFIWAAITLTGLLTRSRWLLVLGLAGLIHLATDFPLHHDDGRPIFWPISDWVFQSPVSYWDPSHFGNIVGPLEAILSGILCVFLWYRFRHWASRLAIVALGIAELAPAFLFGAIL